MLHCKSRALRRRKGRGPSSGISRRGDGPAIAADKHERGAEDCFMAIHAGAAGPELPPYRHVFDAHRRGATGWRAWERRCRPTAARVEFGGDEGPGPPLMSWINSLLASATSRLSMTATISPAVTLSPRRLHSSATVPRSFTATRASRSALGTIVPAGRLHEPRRQRFRPAGSAPR
jgi:hypothetical protein